MNSITEEIENLKRQKNAVILAHYYVPVRYRRSRTT